MFKQDIRLLITYILRSMFCIFTCDGTTSIFDITIRKVTKTSFAITLCVSDQCMIYRHLRCPMLKIFAMGSTPNFAARVPIIHNGGHCGHHGERIYGHTLLALTLFGRTDDLLKIERT